MQNSLEKGQGNHDERETSMEESPMMTVEYLRARLLSERSVSKAAKDRAEELAKRVEELEDQLKLVTFQRKRAEKATLEVLSFLASHGIDDISEVYESESDQEESLCESNEGKYDATQEADKFGSLKLSGNNEGSGSDHDSTTSSGRPLSWKGRKETTRVSNKKYFDSSIRRRASFAQVGSSQRHRPGKSCRQIKRREMRSMVEEFGHDSANSDAQDNKTVHSSEILANCLDSRGEVLGTSPEKQFGRVHQKNEVSLSLLPHAQEDDASSPIHKHECSGDMQRALEHQAQLIGRYEAQEKAQRDWEERYGEQNISTPDSCEPGNHSDVTEERDENKESVPRPSEIVARHGQEPKAGAESNIQGKESPFLHFNSFKLSPHAENTVCSQNHNSTQTSRSVAPEFSFSTVNSYQTEENLVPPSFHSSAQSPPHLNQSASPVSSSFAGSTSFYESEAPENQNRHLELVPREGPQRLGSILGALQEAKLLIKQQMTVFPETNSYSSSGMKDTDWLKVPVGSSALFRVPTNLHSQAPTQSRFPGSNYEYSSEFQNSSPYSRALPSQDDLHSQTPTQRRFPGLNYEYSSELRNSSPYLRDLPSQDDLHSQAPTRSRFPGSNYDYSSELGNSSAYYSRAPPSQNDRYTSSSMDSRINVPIFEPFSYSPVTEAKHGISNGHPREDFLFDTSQPSSIKSASPSYPSFPDFFPGMSSKQMSLSRVPRRENGIPPQSGNTLYYDHDVRENCIDSA